MAQLRDPITRNPIDQEENRERWRQVTAKFVRGLLPGPVASLCQAIHQHLDNQSRGKGGEPPKVPLCDHAPDSYLPDHLLLTSAIAYCLAYDAGLRGKELLLVRLAVLAHEFPADDRDALLGGLVGLSDNERAWLCGAWKELWEQGEALATDRGLNAWQEAKPWNEDPRSRCLWQAHLAASDPLYNHIVEGPDGELIYSIGAKGDFERHPLHRHGAQVGLVFGGATKIKGYVFDSARLPEIRGASTLFDRINLLDAPALLGREPDPEQYPRKAYQEAMERYEHVRQAFIKRLGHEPPLAPECVIYANGGDILTLAPASLKKDIAAEIEQLYTTETLVGQSVAVSAEFTLLELQYGLRPTDYWLEQYRQDWQSDRRPILEAYYGQARDPTDAERRFLERKCFNELATTLALMRHKRRDGNDHKPIPHYEVTPYTHRCHSCDRRGAVHYAEAFEHYLCEPCFRKTVTGLYGKKKRIDISQRTARVLEWHPQSVYPWYVGFEERLTKSGRQAIYCGQARLEEVDNPWDLGEIAQASEPPGFIGVIYADGNNVGSLLQRIRTPSAYRQFAQRLFWATQHAVFTALAQHLKAFQASASDERTKWTGAMGDVWIHPFEIISIGGDDLFLVVPGSKALDIAVAINRYLEECFGSEWLFQYKVRDSKVLGRSQRYILVEDGKLREWRPRKQSVVSLSAGVVVGAEKTPFFFLQDLATDLLKSAKQKAKGMKYTVDYHDGTVDFLFLKSVPMVTTEVKEFRNEAYALEKSQECLRLVGRPYTTWEMEGLLETARAFKAVDFPRSQLHAMRRFLRLGRLAATINYLYFAIRSDKRHVLFQAFHQAWHRPDDPVPWRSVQKSIYESTLLDLIEIYEFVQQEP